MQALHELREMGMAALQLPHVLRQRGCGSIQYLAERNARYPVLLVHGYAASESVWTPLRRALAAKGFGHIVSAYLARIAPGRCARIVRSLVPELVRTETLADAVAPIDAGRELMAT